MKTLIAGPWVGEFGWELFCWQGHIRSISKSYDKVAVICKPNHGALYEDFADKIIEYKPATNNTNAFLCEGDHGDCFKNKYECTTYLGGHFNIGYPVNAPHLASTQFKRQVFKQYGEKSSTNEFDIIIHARSTSKYKTDYRNYSIENWNKLVDKLGSSKSIACIGTTDSALHVENTKDLRGIPLNQLVNVLASSKVIAGPSSGPMHLATLCGCPQVVWSGAPLNEPRYLKYWNPFNIPVKYIHAREEWNVEPEAIIKNIEAI